MKILMATLVLLASLFINTVSARELETFTFVDGQATVSTGWTRVRITGVGTLGLKNSPVKFTWMAHVGAKFPVDATMPTYTWTDLQGGVDISVRKGTFFELHQKLRAGTLASLSDSEWDLELASVTAGTAFDERIQLCLVNTITFMNDGPFYYYEGSADYLLLKNGNLRIGGYYQKEDYFQAGPRFVSGGFYLHVGVIHTPMVTIGVQHSW